MYVSGRAYPYRVVQPRADNEHRRSLINWCQVNIPADAHGVAWIPPWRPRSNEGWLVSAQPPGNEDVWSFLRETDAIAFDLTWSE